MNWAMLNKNYQRAFTEFLAEVFPDVEESIEKIDPDLSKFEFLKKYDLRFYGIHNLYEYFDGKQIFISIDYYADEFERGFNYSVEFNLGNNDKKPYDEKFDINLKPTRTEAEIAAFTCAFNIREKQLIEERKQ